MATELAKAYVQIIPSAQGIKGSIASVIGPEVDNASAVAKSGLSTGLAAAAGVAAAKAAMVIGQKMGQMIGESLGNYREYEQLVGGVETLYKESADKVRQYASEAYRTAGMSANEYMNTVTSFSASLLQSLGGDTAQAADIGNMAIMDMSDNANKMGTSMQSIQNAYQGFAKQNYTMLDNLKLGYGGTKSEMERLLQDATALSGVEYDISSLSDVYSAIHVIQEELGITGTTALEASDTIQGATGSMKAAWDNLLTGLADENANVEELVNTFVETAVTSGSQIIPRVTQILGGLGELILQASDKLVPMVLDAIIEGLPQILAGGVKLVATLALGIVEAIPDLVAAIPKLIAAIVGELVNLWPEVKQAGIDILENIKEGFLSVVETAKEWGADLIESFIGGIKSKVDALKGTVGNVASSIKKLLGFSEPDEGPLSDFHTYAPDMMMLFAEGIRKNLSLVRDAVGDVARTAQTGLTEPDMMAGAAPVQTNSTDNTEAVIEAIMAGANLIVSAIDAASNGTVDWDGLAGALWGPLQRQNTIHGTALVSYSR